jgi:hypothetical protein
MKFRKLRIAWSVFCGLPCVLLIALWVRSYWCKDTLEYSGPSNLRTIVSERGEIHCDQTAWMDGGPDENEWSVTSENVVPHNETATHGFSLKAGVYDNEFSFTFPQWSPVLAFMSVGAVPWIGWSKRFSIRSLLIATTLVAAVLGLAVWAVH